MRPEVVASPPRSGFVDRMLGVVAPVARGEGLTALLLLVNVFVLLTCYYVLKVLREPLILLGGGAELKAYASAGQALLLLIIVPTFGFLASRTSRIRLMTIVQLFFIACLVAFYLLVRARAPIGLAFYLWVGIFNVLVVSNFWAFANDLYTKEQGQRLFSVIGLGGSVGAILGAFVPEHLHSLGAGQLMLIAAGGLAVSNVLYRLVDRCHRIDRVAVEAAGPDPERPVGGAGGFTLVVKDRYLRLIAVMLLATTVINTTGEYVIGKMATDRSAVYARERSTAHASGPAAARPPAAATAEARDLYLRDFYASYFGIVNLVSALLQALVVSRVVGRLGVRGALFIMPIFVVGGWLAFLGFATLRAIRIEKTVENSLDYSLHNTLRQALYLPTSRASKYKAKAAIDTFFFRIGDVIAGVGLVFVLVHVLGLGVRTFAILNVLLALGWLLLAARTGRLFDDQASAQATREARALRTTG